MLNNVFKGLPLGSVKFHIVQYILILGLVLFLF